MKSNTEHIRASLANDIDSLISQIKKEKETLVSMFLTNASISELADQYKLIDELNVLISSRKEKGL